MPIQIQMLPKLVLIILLYLRNCGKNANERKIKFLYTPDTNAMNVLKE